MRLSEVVRKSAARSLPAWVLLLALASAGCAASSAFRDGQQEAALGDWDRAVLAYAKATSIKPSVSRYQIALKKARLTSSQIHFEKGRKLMAAGQVEPAIAELQQATTLDPTNQHVQVELEKALIEWQRARDNVEKTEMELMKERAKLDRGVPKLNPASNIPILLAFPNTEIGKIYEAMSKASGINFLYDTKLDLKKKVSIELTNVSFENAMNTLMLMNKHFFKVIDENTILLAEDSQQKRREIEDEVIKTFFLSNADVKDVQTLLRTLLDARKIVQNNQLNAITIRDTPNRVAIAQKIIESNDKSKAELIVDVELMEISRTVSKTLGISLSGQRYSIAYTGPQSIPLNNLGLLKQLGSYSLGPIPSVTLDFLKSDSGTRTIAKPQLRVTEGEKANLHIGDSVPIPTTTFNSTGTVGGSVVPITSFTYQEVGIVIEIEPRVHHNKEVTLKLNVEVSQLGESVSTGQGQSSPSINTRQINTVIRLKDGESNLLAGLIRDDGTEGRAGFPGVIDTPFIRRIFSSQTSTRRETDLILTLTPRIIRIPDIREEDLAALFIGTEGNPHLRGAATSPFGPNPFGARPGDEAEEEAEAEAEAAVADGADEDAAGKSESKKPAAPGKQESGKPAEAGKAGEASSAAEPQKAPGPKPGAPPAVRPAPGIDVTPGVEVGPILPSTRSSGTPGLGSEDALPGVEGVDEEDVDEEAVGEDPNEPGLPPPNAPTPEPTPSPAQQAPSVQPVTVALAPGRLTVAGGGGFAFNLMVAGASNLQKMSLTLKYDPAVAEFDQGLEGIFMRADGTQTQFTAQKAGDGTLNVELRRVSGVKGVSGSGAAAAIRFRPVGPGRTLVNIIRAVAEDPAGKPIPVNPSGADVTISP